VVLGVVLLIMTMTVGIAAGATTLEVWMMETGSPDGAKAFFDAVNTEFEAAHPGVKVNLSWIPLARSATEVPDIHHRRNRA